MESLRGQMPALTEACGGTFAECAAICLDSQGHYPGTELAVDGTEEHECEIYFSPPTPQSRRTWADDPEATELGACGVALCVVKATQQQVIVLRSYKTTGFDYWLGSEEDPLFQKKARLEISGIRSGGESVLARRTREKIDQTKISDGHYPAVIAVMEFSEPRMRLVLR